MDKGTGLCCRYRRSDTVPDLFESSSAGQATSETSYRHPGNRDAMGLCRVLGIIHPFPCVAEIGVVRDQYHQAPLIIRDSTNTRRRIVRLFPRSSLPPGLRV